MFRPETPSARVAPDDASTGMPLRRDDGKILAPRVAPHRLGLQPVKGCLKTPERGEEGKKEAGRLAFADHVLCMVTGDEVEPHGRDHAEMYARVLRRRAREREESRRARGMVLVARAADSSRPTRRKSKRRPPCLTTSWSLLRAELETGEPDVELEARLERAEKDADAVIFCGPIREATFPDWHPEYHKRTPRERLARAFRRRKRSDET